MTDPATEDPDPGRQAGAARAFPWVAPTKRDPAAQPSGDVKATTARENRAQERPARADERPARSDERPARADASAAQTNTDPDPRSGPGATPASSASDPQLYDDVAADWWDGSQRWVRTLHNMAPARFRHFDTVISDWGGRDVLDLGCAGGFMSEALARRGARVTGVDPASRVLIAARAHALQEGLEIDYKVGAGEALPFEDDAFDAIVCVDVLEHVRDLDAVLDEVRRVLRPGGWFLFDTINRTLMASFVMVGIAERVLGLLPRGAHDPKLFIRPAELRSALERRGFDVGKFRGLGPNGLNRRGDVTFGLSPLQAVAFIGAAQSPSSSPPGETASPKGDAA